MNKVGTVQVTNIKVKRDKAGKKYAQIELTHLILEDDAYTPRVEQAIEAMRKNPAVKVIKLNISVTDRNLVFWSAPGMDTPSEVVKAVELSDWRIERDVGGDEAHPFLVIRFRFDMPLAAAKVWLLFQIGENILCIAEDAQIVLGNSTFFPESQGAVM